MYKGFLVGIIFSTTALVTAGFYCYTQPLAIVIPHHDAVKTIRQDFLAHISRRRPLTRTIILLSPDHFSPYQRTIHGINQDIRLKNGLFPFNQKLAALFYSHYSTNNTYVTADHGISNQLADLHSFFPQAEILPLIIGQTIDLHKLNQLSDLINRHCAIDCLLVASVDFSHYLPPALAQCHDATSLRVLNNREISQVNQLEVDSRQSLYLLLKHVQAKRSHWHLFSHTNSAVMENRRDAESTSHIMGEYRRGRVTPALQTSTFLLAADITSQDLSTLGERFFYGVDRQLNQLRDTFIHSPLLTATPATGSSQLTTTTQGYHLSIGQDLVVCGIADNRQLILNLLPIEETSSGYQFIRGHLKTTLLDQLFLNTTNHIGTPDPYQGRLTISMR